MKGRMLRSCCCAAGPGPVACLAGSTVSTDAAPMTYAAISGSLNTNASGILTSPGDLIEGEHAIPVNRMFDGGPVIEDQTNLKHSVIDFHPATSDAHLAFYEYYDDSDNWSAWHVLVTSEGNESHETQRSPARVFKYPIVHVFQRIKESGTIIITNNWVLDRWTAGYCVRIHTWGVQPDAAGPYGPNDDLGSWAGVEVLTADRIFSNRTYVSERNYDVATKVGNPGFTSGPSSWVAVRPNIQKVRFQGIAGNGLIQARVYNTTVGKHDGVTGWYLDTTATTTYGCPSMHLAQQPYDCGGDSVGGMRGTIPSAVQITLPLLEDNGGGDCCDDLAGSVYNVPRDVTFCDYQLDITGYACAGEPGYEDSWRIFLGLFDVLGIDQEINGYFQRFNEGGGVGISGRIELIDDLDIGPGNGSNTFWRMLPEWIFLNSDTQEFSVQPSAQMNMWLVLDHTLLETYTSPSVPCWIENETNVDITPGSVLP